MLQPTLIGGSQYLYYESLGIRSGGSSYVRTNCRAQNGHDPESVSMTPSITGIVTGMHTLYPCTFRLHKGSGTSQCAEEMNHAV